MRAGRLRHLVQIQRKNLTGTDSYGTPTYGWIDAEFAWADISPVSLVSARGALLQVLDGVVLGLDSMLITLHPQPNVTIDNRVLFTDPFDTDFPVKTYELKAVLRNNQYDEMVFVAIRIRDAATT